MSRGEITSEIERFIRDYISSVEHLEVLLLLAGQADKQWSAVEASQKLYRQSDSIAMRLEDLRNFGLVRACGVSPLTYCYDADGSNSAVVSDLEAAYRYRKDSIIKLIFSTPRDNLRVFSDAFRIRRDK